jgi:hypothetical protein
MPSLVVRDLKAKLVLDRHDQLYVVEGVEAEVLHKVRLEGNLKRRRRARYFNGASVRV